jgi:NADPH-dependent glutamate synthase beta subunit-like oxidoreductase
VPSLEAVSGHNELEITEQGTLKVDPATFKTTADQIFAAGDCVTGPSSVIKAIAGGQRAAVSIDKMLGGSGILPQDTGFSLVKPDEDSLAGVSVRAEEKTIPLSQRKRGFAEVVLGLDREQALTEAGRCLRCDLEKNNG